MKSDRNSPAAGREASAVSRIKLARPEGRIRRPQEGADARTALARSREYARLARCFAEPLSGLEGEYSRLFLGPERPVAHLHESVYLEGQMMGECTLAVRQSYVEEGLACQNGVLPDHVAVELEFMAHLTRTEAEAWQRGDEETALGQLHREESFLREHLLRWLPRLCQQVLASEADRFYASLAQEAREHAANDMARLRAWLIVADPGAEAEEWSVVTGSGCTLCGVCTRICHEQALSLIWDDNEIFLFFDSPSCDGCAACQQWCPEHALTVEPSPATQAGRIPLTSSSAVVCPSCGEPHAPSVLMARVQQRVAPDEALRKRLALCPACKTSSQIGSFSKEA